MARREVRRVAVVGDTGCKPNGQSGCGLDDPAWPFQTLAQAAAGRQPALVLHVGDYNYRGTPSSFEQTVDGKQVQQWYYDAGDGAEPSGVHARPRGLGAVPRPVRRLVVRAALPLRRGAGLTTRS